MAANTKIEWCTHTFNPWIGCTKVSPACAHCYAEAGDNHWHWTSLGWGPGKPRHRTSPQSWKMPLQWNRLAAAAGKREKIFCASLADVFDPEVDSAWRGDLWSLIRKCPSVDWLLLTKRPANISAMLPPDWNTGWPHVWLGVSVEDQKRADERIPLLVAVPAVVHFLSVEPLLELIQFPTLDHVEWAIVGGESGPSSRPMKEDWVLDIRRQCRSARTAFFFKQWGGIDKKAAGRLLQGTTYDEFPTAGLSGA